MEGNFQCLQGWMLPPANTPGCSSHSQEGLRESCCIPSALPMSRWGPAPQGIPGASLPCSSCVTAQRMWQTPQLGLLASLPSVFARYHPRWSAAESPLQPLAVTSLQRHSIPWILWVVCKKGALSKSRSQDLKKELKMKNWRVRIWRKMSGIKVRKQTPVKMQQMLLFREEHPVQVPGSTKTSGDTFAGTNIPGKVDGRTSISWTGGSNKSFMKRIRNIIARAKRMLICFATWSNGMTGLEGCSHFGGWLLQLIQSINFAALLQAELVPSDLKLSMHLFYQKICMCVWDCLINELLFNINMQKSLLPQRCVNIYIFLVKEACLWLF